MRWTIRSPTPRSRSRAARCWPASSGSTASSTTSRCCRCAPTSPSRCRCRARRARPTMRWCSSPARPWAISPTDEAVRLLRAMHETMGDRGGALIGIDLQKSPAIIEAAYNDADGVTAAFTLNLLARLNRDIGSDFDLDGFEHRADYVDERGPHRDLPGQPPRAGRDRRGPALRFRRRRGDAGRVQPEVHRRRASPRSPPRPG